MQLKKESTGRDSLTDWPGRADDPSTFLDTGGNEQKPAAYVGYKEISNLRELTISWPLVKAYPSFDAVCKNMSRKSPFLLIHGGEEAYTDVNREEKWPLDDTSLRSRHVAAYSSDTPPG
jgi:hypothetical protein